MVSTRLIPCIQLRDGSLVKTRKFRNFQYVGDPANTCRIFNECEVDELVVVDINASVQHRGPSYDVLASLAEECFMPVAYGGGIKSVAQVEQILRLGIEKVIVGSAAYERPELLTEISCVFGAQCVIAAIDVKRTMFGDLACRKLSGSTRTGVAPEEWAKRVEDMGAGEILLTSIDREGTWSGFDLELIQLVTAAVSIPVVAHGGAGAHDDIRGVIEHGGASAVALGNMVVFQKEGMGVLVNFPSETERTEMGL